MKNKKKQRPSKDKSKHSEVKFNPACSFSASYSSWSLSLPTDTKDGEDIPVIATAHGQSSDTSFTLTDFTVFALSCDPCFL